MKRQPARTALTLLIAIVGVVVLRVGLDIADTVFFGVIGGLVLSLLIVGLDVVRRARGTTPGAGDRSEETTPKP